MCVRLEEDSLLVLGALLVLVTLGEGAFCSVGSGSAPEATGGPVTTAYNVQGKEKSRASGGLCRRARPTRQGR